LTLEVLFGDPDRMWRKSMIGVGRPMPRIGKAFSVAHRAIGIAILLAVCSILDMDGDKKVTDVEFAIRKIDAFSAPDRNEDNYLSQDEVLITPERFKIIDRNGDGKISGVEFIDSDYGQFPPYDADRNGTVDLQELTKVLAGQ
jgi:hypothetical protein